MESYEQITPNFKINGSCMETYPCKHKVILDNNQTTMSGVAIYNYCVQNNIAVPEHFKEYKNKKNLVIPTKN